MSFGSKDSATPADTSTIKEGDETFTSAQAASPVPHLIGETRTALRWITPIYGQRVVVVKQKSSK